jgi:hypothetical protein
MKIVSLSVIMLALFTVTANAQNTNLAATTMPYSRPAQPKPTPMTPPIAQSFPQTGVVSKIETSVFGEIVTISDKNFITSISDHGYQSIAVGKNCTVTKNLKNNVYWFCV